MTKLMQHSALAAAALVLSALTTSASAQDFYWDDYEGGLVDIKRNLVWAVDPGYIAGTNGVWEDNLGSTDFSEAKSIAENYPEFVANWDLYNLGYITSYANVTKYWSDQGYGWRLPTLEEAQGFAQDYTQTNTWMWAGLHYDYNVPYRHWTSTVVTVLPKGNSKKKSAQEYHYTVDRFGAGYLVDVYGDAYYTDWPLVVRPLEPQP